MTDSNFWDLIGPVIDEQADSRPTWTPQQVLAWLAQDEEVVDVLRDVARTTEGHLSDYVDALGDYLTHIDWTELDLIDPPS